MEFRLEILNVQQIERLSLKLDLARYDLTCIIGRNGVGKTTLVRALKNLSQSDTFLRTAPAGIFSAESRIRYWVDGEEVTFQFDERIQSLNCRADISHRARSLCAVELPIPHGERFNYFQSISRADRHIRGQIVLEEYSCPKELFEFLSDVYSTDKFKALVETRVEGQSYYSLLRDDGSYLREDYFSSGEYFLINLYRTIMGSSRLIVVDEIDISLDAAAQVKVLKHLREFCRRYRSNLVFTTHSLAMMRTLEDDELFYMERRGVETELRPVSYSYVKSLLYGFSGWDRYILTEDPVLHDFIESLIRRSFRDVFFKYKIIYIGGGSQVVDLLGRNRENQFFSVPANVIAILDGDQRDEPFAKEDDVYCLPFDSVEKVLYKHYKEQDFPNNRVRQRSFGRPKDLFGALIHERRMSRDEVHEYICGKYELELEPILERLRKFLLPE